MADLIINLESNNVVGNVVVGEKGDPGYTPVRGRDYWTEVDKAAIENDVRRDIKDDLKRLEQKTDALWKLNEGQTYDFVEQEETGMNNAPKGAKYMTAEEVYGKTEQKSTNGINLLACIPVYSEEKNGVTFSSDGNGTYRVKGTPTSSVTFSVPLGFQYTLPNETLYWHLRNTYSTTQISFYVSNGVGATFKDLNRIISTASLTNGPVDRITITIPVGETYDFSFTPSIEKSNVVTDYEPYTGGIPSPNPDYPQEIHSVERIDVKVTGKNLCKAESSDLYYQSGSSSYENGSKIKSILFPVEEGVYTFSFKGTANRNFIYLSTEKPSLHNNSGYISTIGGVTSGFRLTVPNGANWACFYYSYNEDTSNVTDFQLEAGSVATEYEPYTEQTISITPPRPLNAIGVYRDKCDAENGVWKYNNANIALPSLGWSRNTSGGKIYFSGNGIPIPTENYAPTICDRFVPTTWSSGADGIYVQVSGEAVVISKSYDTVSAFMSAIGNARVIYPVATPQTEPISAEDLALLRSLELSDATGHIFVTDQDGNDVSYLLEYVRKLNEVN